MLNEQQKVFLQHAADAAAACEDRTLLPAEITLAQAILESGWGTRMPGNNCFGIKFVRRHALSQMLVTAEVIHRDQMEPGDVVIKTLPDGRVRVRGKRAFAAYASLAECFEDHALLITTAVPYRAAWNGFRALRDVHSLIRDVARVYATDPEYALKLEQLADMPAVRAAIENARGAAR